MKTLEAAKLLALASSIDFRLNPPTDSDTEARATVWAMTLDDDLLLEDAVRIVAGHYSNTTQMVMPADINVQWRSIRRERSRAQREQLEQDALRAAEIAAVPMPPKIRAALRAIERSSVIPE